METKKRYEGEFAIFHLIFTANLLTDNYLIFEKISKKEFNCLSDSDCTSLLNSLSSQILLLANTFLDEYDHHIIPKNFNADPQKLLEIKSIVRPAIDRIRKWTDLSSLRNEVLAHSYRSKKQNNASIFEIGSLKKYKIPNSIPEIGLLAKCIILVKRIFWELYKDEYERIGQMALGNNYNTTLEVFTNEQAEKEIESIRRQIQINIDTVTDSAEFEY